MESRILAFYQRRMDINQKYCVSKGPRPAFETQREGFTFVLIMVHWSIFFSHFCAVIHEAGGSQAIKSNSRHHWNINDWPQEGKSITPCQQKIILFCFFACPGRRFELTLCPSMALNLPLCVSSRPSEEQGQFQVCQAKSHCFHWLKKWAARGPPGPLLSQGHVSFVLSGSQKCNGFPSAKETTWLSCGTPFKVIDIDSKVIKGPLNEMHQMCMECT